MVDRDYVRSAVLQVGLEDAPPMVRASLLDDAQFRAEYGVATDERVAFGDRERVWFQRSRVFGVVRRVLDDRSEAEVVDTDGKKWKVTVSDDDGSSPKLVLSQSGRHIDLANLGGLSPYRNERLESLKEAVADVNLEVSAAETWAKVLTVRALDDEEVQIFFRDVCDTPVETERSILTRIRDGRIGVAELVPSSRLYFERLVGRYDGSTSIAEYAAGGAKVMFEQLRTWGRYQGTVMSLYLAWHSALMEQVSVDELSGEEMVRVLESVVAWGDSTSQLGAIELGLRVLVKKPELEPLIVSLIAKLREDDPKERDDEFAFLSGLFVLVDGEIARRRVFATEPPFYRRLASLAHAALVHRQFVRSGVVLRGFREWAYEVRGRWFLAQSMSDQRREPGWCAFRGSEPTRFRAEFLARMGMAAKGRVDSVRNKELWGLIVEMENEIRVRAHWPGPLEGTRPAEEVAPREIREAVERDVGTESAKPKSFETLLRLGFLGKAWREQGDLAARALRSSGHRLAEIDDRQELWVVLRGLATVAGISGSCELADEVRLVVRHYRNDREYRLGIDRVIEIAVIAAASRVEATEWREFMGEWITEIAFGELEETEGRFAHSCVWALCQVVPELWLSCGRAEAALAAYNGR